MVHPLRTLYKGNMKVCLSSNLCSRQVSTCINEGLKESKSLHGRVETLSRPSFRTTDLVIVIDVSVLSPPSSVTLRPINDREEFMWTFQTSQTLPKPAWVSYWPSRVVKFLNWDKKKETRVESFTFGGIVSSIYRNFNGQVDHHFPCRGQL